MTGPRFFRRWREGSAARAGVEASAPRETPSATPGCGARAEEFVVILLHRMRDGIQRRRRPSGTLPSPTASPLLAATARAPSQESDTMMTAVSSQTDSSVCTELVSVGSQTPPELSQVKCERCDQSLTSSSTQTDPMSECRSTSQHQERAALRAQRISISQPDTNMGKIASGAAAIACLRSNVASMQGELQLLRLRVLPFDEDRARGDVQLAEHDEWAAVMREFDGTWPPTANNEMSNDVLQGTRGSQEGVVPPRAAELTVPESASRRPPSFARECLFIDRICHWVATFVHRDWARVCSTSAQAVYEVLCHVQDIWGSVTVDLGRYQSLGSGNPADHRDYGPEPGVLPAARRAVLDLRHAVGRAQVSGRGVRWYNRFALHIELAANLYDEMRMRIRLVYYEARCIVADLLSPIDTLGDTLDMRNARVAAAAERDAEGTPEDGPT
eukprot:TRINITY_DN9469_c0_g1_i1.p1 TRINITY_DN9469_c0_g1~~TRINITY_DN9469_c0_g1_i1.p1  ORF type:complete len:471 (+),score=73.56 TRINITY_DN9469_c0_g1_i1:84-1415(+)